MKITLEDTENEELEVIIKGNISDNRVQYLISILKANNITRKIILFDEEKEMLTRIDEILFFESSNRKVFAVTANNRFVCKYTLAELLAHYKNQGISQIGKGLLVNIHHVKSLEAEFSGNYVATLDHGTTLTITRFYMKEFRNAIMEVSL